MANGVDHDVRTEAAGEPSNALDWIGLSGVDRVSSAKPGSYRKFAIVDVDGDDPRCAGEAGPRDRRAPDSPASDDGD
jgi:hypothetical protein